MSSGNPLAASIGSRVVDATAGEEIGFPVLIGTREYQVFWISLEGPIGVGKSPLFPRKKGTVLTVFDRQVDVAGSCCQPTDLRVSSGHCGAGA